MNHRYVSGTPQPAKLKLVHRAFLALHRLHPSHGLGFDLASHISTEIFLTLGDASHVDLPHPFRRSSFKAGNNPIIFDNRLPPPAFAVSVVQSSFEANWIVVFLASLESLARLRIELLCALNFEILHDRRRICQEGYIASAKGVILFDVTVRILNTAPGQHEGLPKTTGCVRLMRPSQAHFFLLASPVFKAISEILDSSPTARSRLFRYLKRVSEPSSI